MSQPSKDYPLSNPAAVAQKVAAAGGPHIDVTQPAGQATASTALGDVTLSWVIADGSITITIVHKPWAVSAGTIFEHVDSLFA